MELDIAAKQGLSFVTPGTNVLGLTESPNLSGFSQRLTLSESYFD